MYLIYNERKPTAPRTCPNCHVEFGEKNSGHLVPPCFGDRAFYTCDGEMRAGEQILEIGPLMQMMLEGQTIQQHEGYTEMSGGHRLPSYEVPALLKQGLVELTAPDTYGLSERGRRFATFFDTMRKAEP